MQLVQQIACLLLAAVLVVPLAQKFRLGSVLGYLLAGMMVGPWGAAVVGNVEATLQFSEMGVVLLLFVIGLELELSRLWALRGAVFGLGSAQLLLTAGVAAGIAVASGLKPAAAILVGLALALSSTALVMATLSERGDTSRRHGREAFGVLLFQDLAVIPILALLPLIAPDKSAGANLDLKEVLRAGVMVAALLAAGRYIVRPLLNRIAASASREIFTAASLLLVVGAALGTEAVGLSMSLGAFLAGVILADSELRHELQADIEPFRGLLMGLFFMSVGMSADFALLGEHPLLVLALTLALIGGKAIIMYAISRLAGAPNDSAQRLAVTLAQGGEFAFVLFAAATARRVLPEALADLLVLVVIASLLAAPLFMTLHAKLLDRWSESRTEPEYDTIEPQNKPVIIAGFGRVGQVVGRVLRMSGIPFTALEAKYEQVDFVRRFGIRVFYGDASRLDLLQAAGAAQARLFVLAIDDMESSMRTAEMVKRHFPALPVVARARNRVHYFRLRDLGIDVIHRETFGSSLAAAEDALKSLGMSESDARHAVALFREHDETLLERQYSVHENEDELIQTTRQAAAQLRETFEQDMAEAAKLSDDGTPRQPAVAPD